MNQPQPQRLIPRTQPTTMGAFLLLMVVVASTGSLFHPGQWYLELKKPVWTPPASVFPIAWTLLYLSIAVAGAWAWSAARQGERYRVFLPFALQLVFNMAWSWLFFGRHWIWAGLVDMLVLIIAIVWTIRNFHRASPPAAWLLVPYCLWVAYALTLNGGILFLN